MTISILVHNINRASALEHCLGSILLQQYRPLEVVLLDAGSTDGSAGVIERASELLKQVGVRIQVHNCPLMGVAASRNLAARLASGELLAFLDNDATFSGPDDIANAVQLFQENARCGLVSFRVLNGDTDQIDPTAWVFRRPDDEWADRPFRTFTFAGGAFCVRANAYWSNGGFWDVLQYSREEEDLGLALINEGWEILYSPLTTVRHYPDPRGRLVKARRRKVELRNGLLVLWRRLPLLLAVIACCARIGTMSRRAVLAKESKLTELLRAVPEAVGAWRTEHLTRSPITMASAWRYITLHFKGSI